ncbi:MAG TPA: hypothetical protein VEL74_06835 [Thermoanaerobaculia bacterium]|nr:hypothetical protein [Thermoanaerobaculia bacterium]
MRRATCVRGALLIALLALTGFAGSIPLASADPICFPGALPTCCRCLNRCGAQYDTCIANATTSAQQSACYNNWYACETNCYNGPAC